MTEKRTLFVPFLMVLALSLGARSAYSAVPEAHNVGRLLNDAGRYALAPLHWNGKQWLYLGGAALSVAAAHQADDQVRKHFTSDSSAALSRRSTSDLKDALPGAALLAGTWLYGSLRHDRVQGDAAWSMAEAGVLSLGASTLFKFAAGRKRPNDTVDSSSWRDGGDSFPSGHVSVAFAIGTAYAESGDDDARWARRLVGYGIAAATGYQRLHHNAHWLSDTVAGAALGIATARFVLHRDAASDPAAAIMVVPLDHGLMLTYHASIQ